LELSDLSPGLDDPVLPALPCGVLRSSQIAGLAIVCSARRWFDSQRRARDKMDCFAVRTTECRRAVHRLGHHQQPATDQGDCRGENQDRQGRCRGAGTTAPLRLLARRVGAGRDDPPISWLFGDDGLEWLKGVELPEDERMMLECQLQLLASVQKERDGLDPPLQRLAYEQDKVRLLMTIAYLMLKNNEPYRYATPYATDRKLSCVRFGATGVRRKPATNPAKGNAAAARGFCRHGFGVRPQAKTAFA